MAGDGKPPAFWPEGLADATRESEMRAAMAAFLTMIMPIDGETHPSEMLRLKRILADDFDLDEPETERLIAESAIDSRDRAATERAAQMLREGLSSRQIITLVSHMWEMVFADGRLHEAELLIVERLSALLDVSESDVIDAMKTQ